jgi:argininosuccinate synthase
MAEKAVLAYSGGLDTSVILKWLVDTYGLEVIALCCDIGQGVDELDGLREKAEQSGASKLVIRDVQEEFARDYVFQMLKANAVYEGCYLLGTSIARPLLAKTQMDVAKEEGATVVSHGATGKGNDQVRFELAYRTIDPSIRIIAPWREAKFHEDGLTGREKAMEYAAKHGIPVKQTAKEPWSTDRNLLHISFESGLLEDPWREPPAGTYVMTVPPDEAPDQVTELEIDFERGVPVAVNGEALSPAKLLAHLNEVGGKNGVGRVDMVENRYVGMKSRGVYETPGGTILHVAHRGVESLTMDREVMHLRDSLIPQYAAKVYNGFWFSPEMRALNTFIDATQEHVTGTARVKLYKGNCRLTGRKAPKSLYDMKIATMDTDQGAYRQDQATGFIELNALRLVVGSKVFGNG